jgi:hypothetical protein
VYAPITKQLPCPTQDGWPPLDALTVSVIVAPLVNGDGAAVRLTLVCWAAAGVIPPWVEVASLLHVTG